jgi:hypothetical protein
MLALIAGILLLDYIRNIYFANQAISPIARLRTIFVIVAGTAIMKLSLTKEGFKIFIFIYFSLLAIYYVLNYISMHGTNVKFTETLVFYKELVPLETPLPFIFLWFVDRLFFTKGSMFKKMS